MGDELYYLGLIFTLVSLMYGLIDVSLAGQDETRDAIGQLVGSFAIALISTLVGIVLRIMFQSVSRVEIRGANKLPIPLPDPDPRTGGEREGRTHIDPSTSLFEATIKFEQDLQASVDLVKDFSARVAEEQVGISFIVNDIAAQLEANLKEFPNLSRDILNVTSTQLSDISKKVLENMGTESSKMCGDVMESLHQSCERTLSSLEERSEKTLEQIALQSKDHLNNLNAIYSRNEALVRTVVDKIEQDTSSYLQTVELSISDTSSVIKEAMSDIRLHTSNLGALSQSVNENLRLGAESLQVLDRIARNISDSLTHIQEPVISTERVAKSIADDISIAKSGLDIVVRNLDQLQPSISKAHTDSKAIVTDLETVKLHTEKLRSEVQTSKRSRLKRFIGRLRTGTRSKSE